MREIKFRGKTKEGKWIYGSGIIKVIENCTETKKIEMISTVDYDELDYYVPMYDNEEVIPETVGQYTGLKDKNGKEIYEGDILKINYDIKRAFDLEDIMYVDFIEGAFYLKAEKEIKWSILRCLPALVNIEGNIRAQVIGKIYDNPELLGGNNGYTKDI